MAKRSALAKPKETRGPNDVDPLERGDGTDVLAHRQDQLLDQPVEATVEGTNGEMTT